MNESNDILLAKWLSGEITEEQRKLLAEIYDLDSLAQTLDRESQFVPAVNKADDLWTMIKANKDAEVVSSATEIDASQPLKSSRRGILFILAFVLLALLTAVFFYFKSSNTTIETQEVRITDYLFADGSKTQIGPRSSIEFNDRKWELDRVVKLQGQAFFEVTKGVPFRVETKGGTVEVLGTQFDVWNINEKYMRVSCQEGSVRVSDKRGESRILIASQFVYIVDGAIKEVITSSTSTVEWRGNFRNYETTPIRVVLSDLERFYNVSFIADETIQNDKFTGVLPTNDVNKCIQFIETSLSYVAEQKTGEVIFKKANK